MHSDLMQWAKEYTESLEVSASELSRVGEVPAAPHISYSGDLDSYRLMLRNIPVLDKSEQHGLFEKIDSSKLATARLVIDGLCAANGRAGLFRPEEKDVSIIQSGLSAKRKLMYHNLRLVAWRANYYKFHDSSTIEVEDLISEGVFGLENAIDRFDTSTGHAFSTYAVPWIRNRMARAVRSTSMIPEHMHKKIGPLRELIKAGKTQEEIAKELKVGKNTVGSLVALLQPMVSLDAPISNDGSSSTALGDTISDSVTEEDSYSEVEDSSTYETLQGMLDGLTEQQSRVIRLRFGIGVDERMTLEKIGRREGVTKERIRQIEQLALKKLRKRAEELDLTWLDDFA